MSMFLFPLLACFILVLIHVYFGSFVIKRGVIFIDLALAQWAALGYLVAHLMNVEQPFYMFIIGFIFTLIASVVLAGLKKTYSHVHLQEAMIGVMYIMATVIAITIISLLGMEGNHLREMLSGHLLFVTAAEVWQAALIYSVIALIMAVYHRPILQSSSMLGELVFYALFGMVVTSSVKMVGVLLVFSFLVLPIITAILFSKKFWAQLNIGWIMGILASSIGLWTSLRWDIPPSYAVILWLMAGWLVGVVVAEIQGREVNFKSSCCEYLPKKN